MVGPKGFTQVPKSKARVNEVAIIWHHFHANSCQTQLKKIVHPILEIVTHQAWV
jgi:hypothetical protein